MWRLFAGFLLIWKEKLTNIEGKLHGLNLSTCSDVEAQVNKKYTWDLLTSNRIIAAFLPQYSVSHYEHTQQ